VLLSDVAARAGLLDLPAVIAVPWPGSFLGDQLSLVVGRRRGGRLLTRVPRLEPGVARALCLLERYDAPFILSSASSTGCATSPRSRLE
jgi:membrane protein DedA with SNARE-associated domain